MKKTAKKPVKTTKPLTKTRADRRQDILSCKIEMEQDQLQTMLDEMAERLFYLDQKEMNPIDKDLLLIRYYALETYSAVLSAIAHYEKVRIRRRDGERLSRSIDGLLRYMLGDSAEQETRIGTPCICKTHHCCK